MAFVKISNEQVSKRIGRFNRAKINETSEAEIESAQREENFDENNLDEGIVVVPGPDIRRIRSRLQLSQEEFSERFGLSLRTVQEWEQHRRSPDGPARLLLDLIEAEPKIVARLVKTAAAKRGGKQERAGVLS